MYCYSYLCCDVCGQRTCGEDSNVLDSCDGRIISNNNMNVDFGLIKYQCSCSFTPAFNKKIVYTLSINPGYKGCGTAIQINEINGTIFSMPCSTEPITVFSEQSTSVKLTRTDVSLSGSTGYCLRVLSNEASINVIGTCQSKDLPRSSSESSITTLQGSLTSSSQSYSYLFFLFGACGIVLVTSLTSIVIVKRKKGKKTQSKKELTENIYHTRKEERLQDDFKFNPVEQSAIKTDTEGSQNQQSDENRGSGYWMVENSFYLSADKVVRDDGDGHQNVLDINPALYSEINDSENKVYKNTAFEYDYAQVRGSQ